jgi:hypothetical protein
MRDRLSGRRVRERLSATVGAREDQRKGTCAAAPRLPPYYGVCWKACTPFTTECPSATCSGAHLDVDQSTLFEACREIGTGALGTSCTAQFDCAEDTNCQGKGQRRLQVQGDV